MKAIPAIELIGMMDSPFVRRVAIALEYYGLPFINTPLSVYRSPELLAAINPLMTVPVLRFGSEQLIDSARILDWISSQAENPWLPPSRDLTQAAAVSDVIALKTGEYYREVGLREPVAVNTPAVRRLLAQINAGLQLLDTNSILQPTLEQATINEVTVAIATSYAFSQEVNVALKMNLVSAPNLERWFVSFEDALRANQSG
jgi:glutathione S-transferase